jgi:hypothetical protein
MFFLMGKSTTSTRVTHGHVVMLCHYNPSGGRVIRLLPL